MVDSFLLLVEKQDCSLYGWKVNHRFKYKGSKPYLEDYDLTYYMNKDCNQILLIVDEQSWGYEDVKYAERIYKEALERRKEK